MGKGRKSFHKEYEPPEEQFVVVVDAWGRSDDRQSYANNIGAWFEIMLRRVYPKEKPQIFRVWYQNTHDILIVELPEVVQDIRPFLGVHPYAAFLTTPSAVGSNKVATIYEYNFRRFDHPERRNWKEHSPNYREIHPRFPVRDPYPLPGDVGLHLFIPVPPPPLKAPYAIPVPGPAVPANPPPPPPPSNCGEGSKSPNPESHAGQHSSPPIAGHPRIASRPSTGRSPSRNAHPSPPPLPPPLTPHRIPQPAEPLRATSEHQRTPQPPPDRSCMPSQSDSAFIPYVPSSHHPAHSILSDARPQAYSRERQNPQPCPPERRDMLPPSSKKKIDIDPYEEDEVAQKLLALSRHPSEYPPEQGRWGPTDNSGGTSSMPAPSYRDGRESTPSLNSTLRQSMPPPPVPHIKPEPTDVDLPPLPLAHHSRLSPRPPPRPSSRPTPTPQSNIRVKLEDGGSPRRYGNFCEESEGKRDAEDVTMAEEGGGGDAEYEPSAELLEALADLDDFAGLLGDELPESSSTQAPSPNPRLEHHGPPPVTPVRVKPEPMDEDHLLVQPSPQVPHASPSARLAPSPGRVQVKPEPMDEGCYLGQPSARGPQPSPSARPTPATFARVQVKPEPMEANHIPRTSRKESARRDDDRYGRSARHDPGGHSPQRHRDDYRRSPSRHDRRPHSYGSPQARWRGGPDDRSSSNSNNRKRNGEARDDRRWSNGEDGRQWNKRPRVKLEDSRN